MPVEYSFNVRLFRLECTGIYTVEDVKHAFVSALDDPGFPTDAALLVDDANTKSLRTVPSNKIRDVVACFGLRAGRFANRYAIVASSDLYHGLVKIAAAFSEALNIETGIFRTESEALAWLGV